MTDLELRENGQFAILEDLDFKLHTFSTFDYGPIQDLSRLDTSSVLSFAESLEIPETLDISESFDIWSFPLNLEEQKTPRLSSWETFYDKTFEEPRTAYISESGNQVFDAILGAQDKDRDDGENGGGSGCLIKSVAFLGSLLELGLGRESVLYRYEEHERSFSPLIANGRISGYSLEAVQSLSATFIDHGNKMKRLQSFVDGTRTSSKSLSTIALASSIAAILATVHAQIVESPRSTLTLLQLHTLYEMPGLVISYLNDMVSRVGTPRSEEEFLSLLYDFVEDSEYSAEWVRPTMFQILANVSKPWLDAVSRWVGLKNTTSAGFHGHVPNFVILREDSQKIEGGKETKKFEYDYAPLSMPNFISEEDGLVIFETGKSLRLLETYQPHHLLFRPLQSDVTEAPDLDWQFSWQDIEKLQRQAQEYELNLRMAIADFNMNGGNSEKRNLRKTDFTPIKSATVANSEETAKAYIHASIATFERPLPDLTIEKGNKSLLKCNYNDSPKAKKDIFAPPLSLLPVLSFSPVIAKQALLINRACLRLLFKEYKIQSHFCLLHRYKLFGDGVFASRLSHALFDPEFNSTECRKGRFRAGVSGLKLGSRDTWPPANSDLRLALMGILTESYYDGHGAEASSMFRDELPGGLSFAIRDMAEIELQRCMDPNSIEALDFLKLQYRPPPPLDAVITQASLAKYDVVFKLLLRATRMLFVVNQLFRDTNPRFALKHGADSTSKIFRIESHHFVSAICRYFFNGVQANWDILQQRLEGIDKALDRDDTSDVDSLHELRDFHETLLDRLMFTLLLRRRQAQVMKLLEEILSLILVFARHTRTEATGSSDFKTDLMGTYEMFRKKVRVFIGVCRGLSERRGEGGTKGYDAGGELSEDGGNTIGRLLLDFEMSGYYTR